MTKNPGGNKLTMLAADASRLAALLLPSIWAYARSSRLASRAPRRSARPPYFRPGPNRTASLVGSKLLLLAALLAATSCSAEAEQKRAPAPKAAAAPAPVPEYTYRVVHIYPHDPGAFTQGLEYRAGVLYEGTGLQGRSTLRKVNLETGTVLQQVPLDARYFGEGITVLNNQIVQLTWQSQTGFVYDQNGFKQTRTFTYPGEGWGLTNDGKQIYMSDGSSEIRRWDAQTLRERGRLTVRDGRQAIAELNELEFVKGELYANVWQTHRIVRISPTDGRVLGWIDLSGLLTPEESAQVDVLNGIAYDEAGDRLFVTGKLWPKLFEIKIIPKRPTE